MAFAASSKRGFTKSLVPYLQRQEHRFVSEHAFWFWPLLTPDLLLNDHITDYGIGFRTDLLMKHLQLPAKSNGYHLAHVKLLLDSYQRLLHQPLLAESADEPDLGLQIFCADFALLSHDTEADPVFNYANQTALQLFELSWQDLINMPSRFSAEPVNQEERQRLLNKVNSDGYIDDYSGVRISKTGKRFLIQRAVVWNVIDEDGQYYGQAACFKDWVWL
jgi:hypothetical protein